MDSLLLQTLPDATKKNNKVPLAEEIATLRALRTQNESLTLHLRSQLSVARTRHSDIQRRYLTLISQLESVKAEFNASQAYISMLEGQEDAFQSEEERLKALLHPMRSCPEDILQLVFEQLAESTPIKSLLQVATTLSHVCQRWRSISLRTPLLWKRILLSSTHDPVSLQAFMQRARERIGLSPANITIRVGPDCNEAGLSEFTSRICLNAFPLISHFEYQVSKTSHLRHLELRAFGFPSPPIKYFHLKLEEDAAGNTWDCATLLNNVPSITALRLDNLGLLLFGGEMTFTSIEKLHLDTCAAYSLIVNLPRFPNLKALVVQGDDFNVDEPAESIVLSSLEKLTLNSLLDFPYDKITAPRLHTFETDDETGIILHFLSRHPSITTLKLHGYEQDLRLIASATPNIKRLEARVTGPSFAEAISPSASFVPFPLLTHLVIDLDQEDIIPVEQVMAVVRNRCAFEENNGQARVRRLHSLCIEECDALLTSCIRRTGQLAAQYKQVLDTPTTGYYSTLTLTLKDEFVAP